MKKGFWIVLVFMILIGLCATGYFYYKITSPINESQDKVNLFIPSTTTNDQLKDSLSKYYPETNSLWFEQLGEQMGLYRKVNSGYYQLDKGISSVLLIRKLRAGLQTPVPVTLNAPWTMNEVFDHVSNQIEASSDSLKHAFGQLKINLPASKTSLFSIIIPNTYEFYWNVKPSAFAKRVLKEHKRFWNQDRKAKAKKLHLTPYQVYTLASIICRESARNEELPRIAGVYINRLKKGIPLQADPTVKFAIGDLSLKRILNKHLEVESPYNTYKYQGLPPGPISIATLQSIEAVLNAENHDYYYFCAKPDYSGSHVFSKTLQEHNRNARKFHRWLNQNNIR